MNRQDGGTQLSSQHLGARGTKTTSLKPVSLKSLRGSQKRRGEEEAAAAMTEEQYPTSDKTKESMKRACLNAQN